MLFSLSVQIISTCSRGGPCSCNRVTSGFCPVAASEKAGVQAWTGHAGASLELHNPRASRGSKGLTGRSTGFEGGDQGVGQGMSEKRLQRPLPRICRPAAGSRAGGASEVAAINAMADRGIKPILAGSARPAPGVTGNRTAPPVLTARTGLKLRLFSETPT